MPPWVPNAISTLRVALVPVWLVLAEGYREAVATEAAAEPFQSASLAVLLTLGISDVLDGWIARTYGLTTSFGAHLDAVADKLAQVCLFTFFALRGAPAFLEVPLWFIAILIVRDALLGVGWVCVRLRCGAVVAEHHVLGKATSFVMFAILVWINAGGSAAVLSAALGVAAALSVVTTALYLRDGWRQLTAG